MDLTENATITSVGCILQSPDHRSSSTFTVKATAQTSRGSDDFAVKIISGRRLANEIAAAWVASKLQLSTVPDVYMAEDPQGLFEKATGAGIQTQTGGRLVASKFCPLPPLFQIQDYAERQDFLESESFRKIIVYDVLIANTDRVDRNVLYSNGVACAFDHDKAFFGEDWANSSLMQQSAYTPIGFLESDLLRLDDNERTNTNPH